MLTKEQHASSGKKHIAHSACVILSDGILCNAD